MKIKSLHQQKGLNLLEILIAALVLSIGLLGLASLQMGSLKTTQNAAFRQQATFIIYELVERMRANRSAVVAGDYVKVVSCPNQPTSYTCAGTCSPSERAKYDLYSVTCSSSGSVRLMNSILIVTCLVDDQCESGMDISLSWVERVENDGVVKGNVDSQGNLYDVNSERVSLKLQVVL